MAVGAASLGVKTGAASGSKVEPGGTRYWVSMAREKSCGSGNRNRGWCVEVWGDADGDLNRWARVGDRGLGRREEDHRDTEHRGEPDRHGDRLPQTAHLLDGVGFDGDRELERGAFVDGVGVEVFEGDAHQELFERPVFL